MNRLLSAVLVNWSSHFESYEFISRVNSFLWSTSTKSLGYLGELELDMIQSFNRFSPIRNQTQNNEFYFFKKESSWSLEKKRIPTQ